VNQLRRPIAIALAALVLVLFYFSSDRETSNVQRPPSPEESAHSLTLSGVSGSDSANLYVADVLAELEARCDANPETAGIDGDLAKDPEVTDREHDEQSRHIARTLSLSSSAENLYVAALLTTDRTEQAKLLKRAVALAPTDAFLIWSAYELCSVADYLKNCPMDVWERWLIDADGSNSEAWVRIAANRFTAGDRRGALEAMRVAATSPQTRRYWPDTIEAVERGVAAAGGFHFGQRVEWAFGVTGAIPGSLGEVGMCSEMSAADAEWAHVCLQYGELAERHGKTQLGTSVARSLQKIALTALGDTEGRDAVEQRIAMHRRMSEAEFAAYDPLIEYLLMSNAEFFYAYMDAIRMDGEFAARQRGRAQIRQRISEQPELACVRVPEYFQLSD
jgi:hypothetical protein